MTALYGAGGFIAGRYVINAIPQVQAQNAMVRSGAKIVIGIATTKFIKGKVGTGVGAGMAIDGAAELVTSLLPQSVQSQIAGRSRVRFIRGGASTGRSKVACPPQSEAQVYR